MMSESACQLGHLDGAEVLLQRSSSPWLVAGRRPQLHHTTRPLLGLLGFPHHTVFGFHQSDQVKGKQGRNCNVFYDLASEVMLHHAHGILLTTQVSLLDVTTQGHPGGWLPQLFL